MGSNFVDKDREETQEWLDSFDAVVEFEGMDKARYLIDKIAEHAALKGIDVPFYSTTPYANTISPENSEKMPGDSLLARNVAAYVRWNAMAMVARANKDGKGLGGHIATYTSVSAMYEVGFNWFFQPACLYRNFFTGTCPAPNRDFHLLLKHHVVRKDVGYLQCLSSGRRQRSKYRDGLEIATSGINAIGCT